MLPKCTTGVITYVHLAAHHSRQNPGTGLRVVYMSNAVAHTHGP